MSLYLTIQNGLFAFFLVTNTYVLIISGVYSETRIHRYCVIVLNDSEDMKKLYRHVASFSLHRAATLDQSISEDHSGCLSAPKGRFVTISIALVVITQVIMISSGFHSSVGLYPIPILASSHHNFTHFKADLYLCKTV